MVVKIAESISGTDEGSGCSGGTVRLSIREGGGNDDKLGDWVMRVHDGREVNHYATREATELAAQNLAFPGGRRFGARHRRADRTVIGLPDLDNCREYAIDETYRALRGDARPSLT
jgi:hypothetical protein